jgi:hypothetical protein
MMGASWKVAAKVLALGVLVNATMISLSFGLRAATRPEDDVVVVTVGDQEYNQGNMDSQENVTFIGVLPIYLNFQPQNYYSIIIQRSYENQSRDENALVHAEALNLSKVTGYNEPDIFPPYSYVNSTEAIPPNLTFQPTKITYRATITRFNATYNATARYMELHPAPDLDKVILLCRMSLYVLINGTWIDPGTTNDTLAPFLGWWVDVVYTFQYATFICCGSILWLSIGLDPMMNPCFIACSPTLCF